jgi:hypothetical protein
MYLTIVAEHVEFKPIFKRDEETTRDAAGTERTDRDEELVAEAVF